MTLIELGLELKAYRKQHKMTQDLAAEKMDMARNTFREYEKGNIVKLEVIKRVCKFIGKELPIAIEIT